MKILSIQQGNYLLEVNKLPNDKYASTRYLLSDNLIFKELDNIISSTIDKATEVISLWYEECLKK